MFDINDPADLAALKSEVETDPNSYGYTPAETQSGVLDVINLPRSEFQYNRDRVSAALIRSGTHYDAYNELSIDEQEYLRWVTGSNGFEEENLPVTEDLKVQLTGNSLTQFGTGNATNSWWSASERNQVVAQMLPIFERDGSRAENLFGKGTVISRNDWIAARDS